MPDAGPIRTLLLDADGVIQRPRADWRDAWRSLLPEARRSDRDVEAFLRDVFVAEQPALEGKGEIGAAVAEVLARWGSHAAVERALLVWTQIDVQHDVLRIVDALRGDGVAVHLATNQQAHRAAFMSEVLGYRQRFEREYYSCRIGAKKPSRAYFEHILADLGCAPEGVGFVDDVAENVEAARAAGIHAVQHHLDAGLERFAERLREFGLRVR